MSEKEKNIKTLTMTSKMNVPISMGTFEYIAGIDPKETWKLVTEGGMEIEDFDELRNKHHDIVGEQINTKEYQEKLQKHLDEVVKLYQGIIEKKGDVVKPYIEGRTFNFVLGMPRTGGTTLYQAMSDIYEWPWNDLLLSMTHNFMPNGKFCVEHLATEYDMGWRLPWNFSSLVFELCQFLVYANNEAPDSEHFFIKSSALSYAVKFLNFLFGNRANYYVTVRHPGAIVQTSGAEEITREDHIQNMSIWTNLYSSIIRECRPVGNLYVVEYGEKLTDFINSVLEKEKKGERIEETSFFEFEDYDKDFYESDSVKQMFDYVKASWKLFDYNFPIPDKCI
ncbi:MAG: hypothetical protein C0602_06890 [Denitrovibrio sp.]|nr:MAG: hypothetical protein C0602_06890 [Denitrovibrio sp.]